MDPSNGLDPVDRLLGAQAEARAALVEERAAVALEAAALARAELCRRSLARFIREAWRVLNPSTPYEHSWHVDAIADHVQAQLEDRARAVEDPRAAQRCQNLRINIPPRCLKSTIVSVCATAWAWARWPDLKIGCLSANPRVASRDALAFVKLVTSAWYRDAFQPAWLIEGDALGNVRNSAGGSRVARGLDATIVGEGFDWLIVDDPHDPRDSDAELASMIDGFDVALNDRVNDQRTAIRTCVMQRVREGDFSDHVSHWPALVIPMEWEPERAQSSPLGWVDPRKSAGEVLHALRFPPEVLERIRAEKGTYAYAAQYQQRPAPAAGGMVQRAWFGRFTMAEVAQLGGLEAADFVAVTLDATFGSTTDTADNVGLLVAAGFGNRRLVLRDASRKMSYLEMLAAVRALLAEFPQVDRVIIEKTALGPAVAAELERDVETGAARPVTVSTINPREHGKKVDRVRACLPQLEAGCVRLLDGADWVAAFIDEHGLFPNGQHDDRVDALSQLLIWYSEDVEVDRQRRLNAAFAKMMPRGGISLLR